MRRRAHSFIVAHSLRRAHSFIGAHSSVVVNAVVLGGVVPLVSCWLTLLRQLVNSAPIHSERCDHLTLRPFFQSAASHRRAHCFISSPFSFTPVNSARPLIHALFNVCAR